MLPEYFQLLLPKVARFALDNCANANAGEVSTPTAVDPGSCNNFQTGLPHVAANSQTVTSAVQIIFGLIGAVAVVYLMYSAIHFMRSQGDTQTIAKARNGIIYALIGLAIVLSAEAIVTFVLGRV